MKFDAKKAKLLQPGTSTAIDGFSGLRMVVSATKRTWIYRYRSPEDNSLKQIKLGEWPALTYPQAIAAWEVARSDREAGIDAAAEKKKKRQPRAHVEPGTYTVRKLSLDYLADIERTRSPSSLLSVTRLFKRLLDPIAGHEPHAVTRADAYDLIQELADRPSLAVKFKSELAQAWDFGINAGKVADTTPNHWRTVMRGKLRSTGHIRGGERMTTKRVLAAGEVSSVLAWLPNTTDLLRDVLTLYLWTGARGGELVQMEGKEVKREADGVLWWTCPKSKTKNVKRASATDYRVPLIGRAAAIVEARKLAHGTGYLFPGAKKGHVSQNAVGEALARRQPYNPAPVDEGLTVSHWAPHDLRRTVRTMLASLGAPHEVGEAILGHVLGGVAGVYNRHDYDKEKVEWLTKLSDEVERLARS